MVGPPHPGEGPPGSGSGVLGALSVAGTAASVESQSLLTRPPGYIRSSRVSWLASPQAAGYTVPSWAWRPCPGIWDGLPIVSLALGSLRS